MACICSEVGSHQRARRRCSVTTVGWWPRPVKERQRDDDRDDDEGVAAVNVSCPRLVKHGRNLSNSWVTDPGGYLNRGIVQYWIT